jgi:hypothetical protein
LLNLWEQEAAATMILGFRTDLMKSTSLTSPTTMLSAVLDEPPRAKPFALVLWTALAAEIYFRSPSTPVQEVTLAEDLATFLKSGHTVVKLNKKDTRSDVVAKLGLLSKDGGAPEYFMSCHVSEKLQQFSLDLSRSQPAACRVLERPSGEVGQA